LVFLLTGEGDVRANFDMGALGSAIEAGGPMVRMARFDLGQGVGGGNVIVEC
jgi:hypothetical protein